MPSERPLHLQMQPETGVPAVLTPSSSRHPQRWCVNIGLQRGLPSYITSGVLQTETFSCSGEWRFEPDRQWFDGRGAWKLLKEGQIIFRLWTTKCIRPEYLPAKEVPEFVKSPAAPRNTVFLINPASLEPEQIPAKTLTPRLRAVALQVGPVNTESRREARQGDVSS